MFKYVSLLIFLFTVSSCEPIESNKEKEPEVQSVELENSMSMPIVDPVNPNMPYDLSKPDKTFELNKDLQEISGLSIAPNKNQLVVINDEKGHLYFINKRTGDLENEIDFGKNRDYEGVETVGDEVFVVESDGELYRVQRIDTEDQDTDNFENKLGRKYDVEGLTYDSHREELLIACKGKPGSKDRYENMRAIYSFDLDTKGYSKEPVYLIDRDEIEEYFDTNLKNNGFGASLRALIDPDSALDAFGPSGIAIHPTTGHLFIISSVGKLLVVLNQNGTIEHVEPLDKKIHRQPEGICFDPDGTLYISNEGKGKRGKIYKFSPK